MPPGAAVMFIKKTKTTARYRVNTLAAVSRFTQPPTLGGMVK